MKLLVFPHSHYCEKARWALEHKGIPFEVAPKEHPFPWQKFPGTEAPALYDEYEKEIPEDHAGAKAGIWPQVLNPELPTCSIIENAIRAGAGQ